MRSTNNKGTNKGTRKKSSDDILSLIPDSDEAIEVTPRRDRNRSGATPTRAKSGAGGAARNGGAGAARRPAGSGTAQRSGSGGGAGRSGTDQRGGSAGTGRSGTAQRAGTTGAGRSGTAQRAGTTGAGRSGTAQRAGTTGAGRTGTAQRAGNAGAGRAGTTQRTGTAQRGGTSRGSYGGQAAGRSKTGGATAGRSKAGGDPWKENKKKPKKKKHIFFRIFNFFCLSILIGGFAVAGIGVLYVYNIVKDIPQYDPNQIQQRLSQSTTIYDDSGDEIKEVFMGDKMRILVKYDALPTNLKNAFISIEDKTFWEHHGFNFTRLAGAVLEGLKGGRISGTSTITQQLARNVWFTEEKRDERTLDRKIREAYYAILLERNLSKEDILTYYLNAISFGYSSYGVEAASQNYFNKHVQDLDLVECAALASLPKMPTVYSMVSRLEKGQVASDDPRVLLSGKEFDYLYSDKLDQSGRVKLVLDSMLNQGRITQAQYDEAMKENLRDHIHPTEAVFNQQASFFTEYAIQNVAKALQKKYNVSSDKALEWVYTGGLNIYTTIDMRMQKIILEEYKDNSNFPQIVNVRKDDDGNIMNEQRNQIMLYKYSNMLDDDGNFTFRKGEYEIREDGSLLIKKGNRLHLYPTTVQDKADVSIEFKDIYHYDKNDKINMINGGVINIPQQYKSLDKDGNCVVSGAYFTEHPNQMIISGKAPVIPETLYTLHQSIIQPQSAMVIVDHTNGQLKAMVGGRNITGQMNYNRAINPRQPGSSVKPLGVYGPAIQMGADKEPIGKEHKEESFGKYWTTLSIVKDEAIKVGGKVWPKNSYSGYQGNMTLRRSMEQSVNVNAVKIQRNVGYENSVEFMERLGISTLEKDKKKANDLNPAALALGGMTRGIPPLEMAAAYGAFANKGVYIAPIAYSKVETKTGEVVLDGKPKKTQAMDPGTAFIVNDIMRGVVTRGTGGGAAISGISVAGKTGTTSDNCDVWFVGNTPKYSAAIWIGNDVKLQLNQTSRAASALWGKIMRQTMKGTEQGSFPKQPDNVIRSSVSGYSDYFIRGTVPSRLLYGGSKEVTICKDSKALATPWCPNKVSKKFNSLNDDDESAPSKYCWLHNLDPKKYPVSAGKKVDKDFVDPNDKTTSGAIKPPKKKPTKPTPTEPTTPTPTEPTTPTPTEPTEPTTPPTPPTTAAGITGNFTALATPSAQDGTRHSLVPQRAGPWGAYSYYPLLPRAG